MTKTNTIPEYIAQFPEEIQIILQKIRQTIHENAPNAVEQIKWQMPTIWQKENLIHFAAAKKHIGIYPGSEVIEVFSDRLKDYKTSKGAVQLPLNREIPYNLIADMVRFRVFSVSGKQGVLKP